MILQIVCSEKELIRIVALFPDAQILVEEKNTLIFSSRQKSQDMRLARLEIIKNRLIGEADGLSSGKIYNSVRRKGYPVSYKSFQSDCLFLESAGYLNKKKIFGGGVVGCTTIWTYKQ